MCNKEDMNRCGHVNIDLRMGSVAKKKQHCLQDLLLLNTKP